MENNTHTISIAFEKDLKNKEVITNIFNNTLNLLKSKGEIKESDIPSISLTMIQLDEYLSVMKEKSLLKIKQQDLIENKINNLESRKQSLLNSIEELKIVKDVINVQLDITDENGLLCSSSSPTQLTSTIKLINEYQDRVFKLDQEIDNLRVLVEGNFEYFTYHKEKDAFVLNEQSKDLVINNIMEIFKQNGLTPLSRSKIEQTIINQTINLFGDDLYDE